MQSERCRGKHNINVSSLPRDAWRFIAGGASLNSFEPKVIGKIISPLDNLDLKRGRKRRIKRFCMRKFQEQYIVNEKGQKTAVVLPVEEYEELLEDMHDLAIIAERRDETTIAFEEIRNRLKEDGLL